MPDLLPTQRYVALSARAESLAPHAGLERWLLQSAAAFGRAETPAEVTGQSISGSTRGNGRPIQPFLQTLSPSVTAFEIAPAGGFRRTLPETITLNLRSLNTDGGTPSLVEALPVDTTLESLVVGVARAVDIVRTEWPDDAHVVRWVEAAARSAALSLGIPAAAERETGADEQSQYLGMLSHELRGGLNGILLMIEVLKGDLSVHNSFGEQLEDLDVMRRSVLETVGLMDRFVYAERFRRGLVKVRYESLDLRTFGEQLHQQFAGLAAEKDMDLTVDASGVADLDRMLVGLIASNLLANALRYGGVSARVTLVGDGPAWRLDVEDNGPGISAGALRVLRESLEARRLLSPGAGGLGLKLVSLAAEVMGATIDVQSPIADGRGTRVVVTRRE